MKTLIDALVICDVGFFKYSEIKKSEKFGEIKVSYKGDRNGKKSRSKRA